VEAVLGVVIKIPREALIPLAIGVVALIILLFFGTKLAEWKARSPAAASRFGLVAAVLFTGVALYFLLRGLTNQSDPNNEGTGQINFTDAPIAGFLGALAAAFWRMANQRVVALVAGLVLGALMIAKPFVWPVMRQWENGRAYARGLIDPEHLMFWGPGVVVIVVALIAAAKKR
jgi:4-amino-4-deoxy-L-arabinose transferase-like glycosyltransferase